MNVQDFGVEKEYEYQEGTDWDWSYLNIHTLSAFAKGEKGYYVRLDEFIYFCDFDKGTLTPVCNRPDCLHDKETDETKKTECIAYLPWGCKGEGIQYYDGKLYANTYVHEFSKEEGTEFVGDQLVCISPDGSSRETLDYKLRECYNFMLHRGSIYYTSYETDPETLVNTQIIYRVDMKTGEQTTIVRLDGMPVTRTYPLGNYVYILVPNGEGPTVRKVIYEISTGKAKVEEGKPQENLLPDKNGTLLLSTIVNSNQLRVEEINMDESQRELIGNLSITGLEDFRFEQGSIPEISYWYDLRIRRLSQRCVRRLRPGGKTAPCPQAEHRIREQLQGKPGRQYAGVQLPLEGNRQPAVSVRGAHRYALLYLPAQGGVAAAQLCRILRRVRSGDEADAEG